MKQAKIFQCNISCNINSEAHSNQALNMVATLVSFHEWVSQSIAHGHWCVNPGTFTQSDPPPWYKGEESFWHLQVFLKDYTFSGEPLIFPKRWGIFYRWWRCWRPVTSHNNYKSSKNRENWYFLCLKCRITLHFIHKIYFYRFTEKWVDHMLVMTSYLVNIVTDHHQTCLKMCLRDKTTTTENLRCWRSIL